VFADPSRGFALAPPVEALISVSSILSYTMAPKLHWTFHSIFHIYHEQHMSENRYEHFKDKKDEKHMSEKRYGPIK
jgi:hypothetical protein